MKRVLIIFAILLISLSAVSAENVTIKGVTFEIPHHYEHGTLKPSSYVYESGLTFRILNLDESNNLRFNFGSDIADADSVEETTIAGHDAVVITKEYNSKPYTTVYFATGNQIFLICFNDTYVNDEIIKIISETPDQTMSHDEFSQALNQASNDYQEQMDEENENYIRDQYSANSRPVNRFYFFAF